MFSKRYCNYIPSWIVQFTNFVTCDVRRCDSQKPHMALSKDNYKQIKSHIWNGQKATMVKLQKTDWKQGEKLNKQFISDTMFLRKIRRVVSMESRKCQRVQNIELDRKG